MKKIQIQIHLLGDTYPLVADKIRSNIFDLKVETTINNEFLNLHPTIILDEDVRNNFIKNKGTDFTVLIVNRQLENNFFTRYIDENLLVMSIFEIEKLYLSDGITIEMYVERYLLAFATMYTVFGKITEEAGVLVQINSTGCLFDGAIYKPDVIKFFREPMLCDNVVKIILDKKQDAYLKKLTTEIKALKIGRYHAISKWVTKKPIVSLFIAYSASLVFNELVGNVLYDLIKKLFGF
jgi:hypothetical protein